MRSLNHFKKQFALSKKRRGQVFILATLIIVVYTVSIIAVVTELSVDRTQTDQIDLPHMVDEYLSEMNYQLQLQLFNYIGNASFSQNDIFLGLQSFISTFITYASTKGIGATINLRLNEFNFYANRNSTIYPVSTTSGYDNTTFISINSTILFQSSNSGSKISGTFNHYYGVNMFISPSNYQFVQLTQRDKNGNILEFITGANFIQPLFMTDQNNGYYTNGTSLAGLSINVILPSGLELVS